jgi:hypothetical protein
LLSNLQAAVLLAMLLVAQGGGAAGLLLTSLIFSCPTVHWPCTLRPELADKTWRCVFLWCMCMCRLLCCSPGCPASITSGASSLLLAHGGGAAGLLLLRPIRCNRAAHVR